MAVQSEKMTVAEAILKVSHSIGTIAKDGKASFGNVNYSFQSWEDVLPEVKTACIEHDLTIVPSITSVSRSNTVYNDNYGKEKQVPKVTVGMEFSLVCGDDKQTASWYGESLDNDDKSIQKAGTSGMKYFLLKLFHITVKGDVDPDGEQGTIAEKPIPNTSAPAKPKMDLHKAIAKEWSVTAYQGREMKTFCQGRELNHEQAIIEANKAGAKSLDEFYQYFDQTGKFAGADNGGR